VRIEQRDSLFMQGFLDKGRTSKVVARIPLRLVLVEDIGERRAQLVAMQAVRRAAGRRAWRARDPIMP
jgi:glucokinase